MHLDHNKNQPKTSNTGNTTVSMTSTTASTSTTTTTASTAPFHASQGKLRQKVAEFTHFFVNEKSLEEFLASYRTYNVDGLALFDALKAAYAGSSTDPIVQLRCVTLVSRLKPV